MKNPELWAVGSRTAKNGIRRALIPASVKVVSKTRIRKSVFWITVRLVLFMARNARIPSGFAPGTSPAGL
jgi:hypothetical protein